MTTIRIHHVSPPSTFAHSTMRQTTRRTASWYSPCVHGVFVRMRWPAYEYAQFVLDISTDEVPYITFEERKNGPGEVSLLYGKEVLEDRIDDVRRSRGVDGYLFPSPHASGGPISGGQSGIALPNSLSKRVCLTKLVVYPRQRWGDASGMTPIPRHSTSSSEASTRLLPNKEARVPTSYCKITSQIRGPGSPSRVYA